MSDPLQRKIRETKAVAAERGFDLARAPLLVTFELPIWGPGIEMHGIAELARHPGTAVAVTSTDPLPEVRRRAASAPNLHLVAERGLVVGLSGGATLHVYPHSDQEMESFAVALFAGVAPSSYRFALGAYVSSGRQEVSFETGAEVQSLGARELLHAVRNLGGTVAFASEKEDAVVVDDLPAELALVREALAGPLAGQMVNVLRLPSGRFRIMPDATARRVEQEHRSEIQGLAQGIAVSCDRFVEARGGQTYGFATEPVARWEYGMEGGARNLADTLFGRPDTVLTHLGLHPFGGEDTLFFAYEGSETVWEAANKGISYVPVRDNAEYSRILHAIRRGEES